MFVPHSKVFVSSTVTAFVLYIEGGFEKPWKRTEPREEKFSENFITVKDGPVKRTKTRQKERKLEGYPTSAVYYFLPQWFFDRETRTTNREPAAVPVVGAWGC